MMESCAVISFYGHHLIINDQATFIINVRYVDIQIDNLTIFYVLPTPGIVDRRVDRKPYFTHF